MPNRSRDEQLRELTRRLEADPGNEKLRLNLLIARGRVEGPDVFLEALRDYKEWNKTPQNIQDLAISDVLRRLNDPSRE